MSTQADEPTADSTAGASSVMGSSSLPFYIAIILSSLSYLPSLNSHRHFSRYHLRRHHHHRDQQASFTRQDAGFQESKKRVSSTKGAPGHDAKSQVQNEPTRTYATSLHVPTAGLSGHGLFLCVYNPADDMSYHDLSSDRISL